MCFPVDVCPGVILDWCGILGAVGARAPMISRDDPFCFAVADPGNDELSLGDWSGDKFIGFAALVPSRIVSLLAVGTTALPVDVDPLGTVRSNSFSEFCMTLVIFNISPVRRVSDCEVVVRAAFVAVGCAGKPAGFEVSLCIF